MAIVQRKKASKKGLIIQKAASMFRERGFAATSMRDLAEAVGIEAASLYNHIKSKNEILEAICTEVATIYNDTINNVENSQLPSIKKIEQLLRFQIQQMIENYEQVYVTDREWKHLSEPYLSDMQNQRRTYRKRFAAIIEKGIAQKEIRPIDAPTAVLIMLHAVSGIESWHRSTKKLSATELENSMITILLDGLRKND